MSTTKDIKYVSAAMRGGGINPSELTVPPANWRSFVYVLLLRPVSVQTHHRRGNHAFGGTSGPPVLSAWLELSGIVRNGCMKRSRPPMSVCKVVLMHTAFWDTPFPPTLCPQSVTVLTG